MAQESAEPVSKQSAGQTTPLEGLCKGKIADFGPNRLHFALSRLLPKALGRNGYCVEDLRPCFGRFGLGCARQRELAVNKRNPADRPPCGESVRTPCEVREEPHGVRTGYARGTHGGKSRAYPVRFRLFWGVHTPCGRGVRTPCDLASKNFATGAGIFFKPPAHRRDAGWP